MVKKDLSHLIKLLNSRIRQKRLILDRYYLGFNPTIVKADLDLLLEVRRSLIRLRKEV